MSKNQLPSQNAPAHNNNGKNFNHKRTKLYNSRVIRTELNDPAFTNPNKSNSNTDVLSRDNIPNKLDVKSFISSRQFEINEFELSQLRSRHSSATRVFQSLPRELRRRTASHNVSRIPKRLRSKALREMGLNNQNGKGETKGVDSNGKPAKAKHSRGRELYRLKRQAKLLQYAGKHKLSGHLITGELVNAKNVKLRTKISMIRDQIQQLSNKVDPTKFADSKEGIERREQYELSSKLNNLLGSYDNTSINEKAKLGKLSSLKYSSRQRNFKWLPTHIWHAKRAKMIKRWGWNLVNQPTMKCFRKISRHSRQKGCIGTDTSYLNSVILNGHQQGKDSMIEIISSLSHGMAVKKKWMKNGNVWEGFLYLGEEVLGLGTINWLDYEDSIKCLIRFHPSMYDQLMPWLLSKVTNDDQPVANDITLHDCRYSLGSINVTGPKALVALSSIIHPSDVQDQAYQLWRSFSAMNDLTTLPNGSLFSFYSLDPRLWTKPTKPQVKISSDDTLNNIIDFKQGKGVNVKSMDDLLTVKGRSKSYANQPTLKELGKRRTPELSGKPIPVNSKDPRIPISIMKLKTGYQLILPWFWVMPFWFTLVHVPHLTIGGLKQLAQVQFEQGQLSFNDYVFTRPGFVESQVKMQQLQKKWEKRPRSKQLQFEKLHINNEEIGEVGSPFGCDWRYLQASRFGLKKVVTDESKMACFDDKMNRIIKSKHDVFEAIKDVKKGDDELSALGKPIFEQLPVTLYSGKQKLPTYDVDSLKITSRGLPPLPIVAIRFQCSGRGHPRDNARIYLVPESDSSRWIDYTNGLNNTITGKSSSTVVAELSCPSKENLIGFVTSATFNLVTGSGFGIGFVDAETVKDPQRVFVVRNVGSHVTFAVKWDVIDE